MCEHCGKVFDDGDETVTLAVGFLCADCAGIEEEDENISFLGHFITGDGAALWV